MFSEVGGKQDCIRPFRLGIPMGFRLQLSTGFAAMLNGADCTPCRPVGQGEAVARGHRGDTGNSDAVFPGGTGP